MKKKVFAAVAALFMVVSIVLSLTACGSDETTYTGTLEDSIKANLERLQTMEDGQVAENKEEGTKFIKVNSGVLLFAVTDLEKTDALLTGVYGVFCENNGVYLFLQRVYDQDGKNCLAIYHVNQEAQNYPMLIYLPEINVGDKTIELAQYLSKHTGNIFTETKKEGKDKYSVKQLLHRSDSMLLTTNYSTITKENGTTNLKTTTYYNNNNEDVEIAKVDYTYSDKEEKFVIVDTLMGTQHTITVKMKDGKPDISTFKVEEIILQSEEPEEAQTISDDD